MGHGINFCVAAMTNVGAEVDVQVDVENIIKLGGLVKKDWGRLDEEDLWETIADGVFPPDRIIQVRGSRLEKLVTDVREAIMTDDHITVFTLWGKLFRTRFSSNTMHNKEIYDLMEHKDPGSFDSGKRIRDIITLLKAIAAAWETSWNQVGDTTSDDDAKSDASDSDSSDGIIAIWSGDEEPQAKKQKMGGDDPPSPPATRTRRRPSGALGAKCKALGRSGS